MAIKIPKVLTCGCCENGCCCATHDDIPNSRKAGLCEYHRDLAFAPLDREYRYDPLLGNYVRLPQGK